MKACIVYDTTSRLAIAAVSTLEDVAPALRIMERETGEALDREHLALEEGVQLVNELQEGDVVILDEGHAGIEFKGAAFQFAVRRAMTPPKASKIASKDVELVEDRENGWHVLRWDETTRSWTEGRSMGWKEAATERRHWSAVRALELMGHDRDQAEAAVAATIQMYGFNKLLPTIRTAARALAA